MSGHPNLVTTLSNINHPAVSAMQYETCAASSHVFKYYVAMIIYLSHDLLVGGMIGPTKSITNLSKY
jgi:hypothetical protein